jgi:hypothetical protein
MNQAAQTAKRSPEFAAAYATIAKKRGKKIATIAIARQVLYCSGFPGTDCSVGAAGSVGSAGSAWAAGLACVRERLKNPIRAPLPPSVPVDLPCAGFFDDAFASPFLRGVK